jgi:hypothetical protein
MFHLLAFNDTLAAVAGFQDVNGIADPVFPRANAGFDYQIPRDMVLLGAYAGGAANVRTRLVTPSITLNGNAQVVPISGTLLPAANPNFMDLSASPLRLFAEESLSCDMESNSATAVACVALVADAKELNYQLPDKGNMRWVRFTTTVTTVLEQWATGTIVFDDALEGGTYGVYGLQTFFATNIASRLSFPSQVQRPGCLGQATAVSRSAPIFWGGLGEWGRFDTFSLPQLECLDSAAAAVSYTGWMLIARLGDQAKGDRK